MTANHRAIGVASSLPLRRLAWTVSLALGLFCSNPAQAHMPSAGELLLSVAGLLTPNAGVDMLTQPSRDAKVRARLSWQFAIPVVDWSRYRNGDPMHHRVVLGPELLLPNRTWRARVGYRFVYHPLFFGAGGAFGEDLGPAGSIELGWRVLERTQQCSTPTPFV